ncbi:MAG: site-specific integrase, partial [Janthinobacterium lividum]
MERLVSAYLDHLSVERGVSAHTLAAYRRDLARYTDHLAGVGMTEPTAVTPAVVGAYASTLAEGVRAADGSELQAPLAPASIARAVVAVRSLHRFAVADGLTTTDPA